MPAKKEIIQNFHVTRTCKNLTWKWPFLNISNLVRDHSLFCQYLFKIERKKSKIVEKLECTDI